MTATLFLFPGTLGVLVAYHLHKPHGPSCSKQGLYRSWNLKFHFLGLESHGIELLGLESHVKLKICIIDKLLQMTKQG